MLQLPELRGNDRLRIAAKEERVSKVQDAVVWNRARHTKADTIKIQKAVDSEPDGIWGPATVTAVMQWQKDHGLKVDGKVGPKTLSALLSELDMEPEWRDLTDEEIDKIIDRTVQVEAGYAGDPYATMNRDAEYEGWFDRPRRDENGNRLKPAERAQQPNHRPHKASKYHDIGGIHIGLSWGIVQFTQDGGSLGKVLQRAISLDPDGFNEVFGDDAPELLHVLTKPGRSGLKTKTLRGPRVQPVGGEDIWKGKWLDRWEAASQMESFRKAQRDIARESYFDPAVELVKDYDMTGQGDLGVAFDMCVQYGPAGARRYFRRAEEHAGGSPSIEEVIARIGSKRLRERREEILAVAEVWVHYTDLVMCVDTPA